MIGLHVSWIMMDSIIRSCSSRFWNGVYLTSPAALWINQPDAANRIPARRTHSHIGDVFQIGGAVLQVSQPRTPCWQINHRFNADGMSAYLAVGIANSAPFSVLSGQRCMMDFCLV
jgi:hypothetical protein